MLFKYKKTSIFIVVGLVIALFLTGQKDLVLSTAKSGLIDNINPMDCGVVLTGYPGRVREAFEILNLKKINRLIVSGVYKDTKLIEIFPHLPYYAQVNPELVYLEKISTSTNENAQQSLQLAQNLKCTNILLITSQLHMYRAYKVFKHYFPESMEIQTYAVENPNKEDSVFEISLEVMKSIWYTWLLGY